MKAEAQSFAQIVENDKYLVIPFLYLTQSILLAFGSQQPTQSKICFFSG